MKKWIIALGASLAVLGAHASLLSDTSTFVDNTENTYTFDMTDTWQSKSGWVVNESNGFDNLGGNNSYAGIANVISLSASGTEVELSFDWTPVTGGALDVAYQLVAWNETGTIVDGNYFETFNWNGRKVGNLNGQADFLVFNSGTVSADGGVNQSQTVVSGTADTTTSYSTTFNLNDWVLDADHDNLDDYEYIGIRIAMSADDLAGGATLNNIDLSVIPEPATIGMLILGATGLLTLRRRMH